MPKRSRTRKNADPAVLAKMIGDIATGQAPEPEPDTRNPAAVALGRLGGLKGGKARAKKLSAAKRRRIAKVAAAARWRKNRKA